MSKAVTGYTILEVLLVLAISTTLLFTAIFVFKGQQGETEFTQAVQDLNSKIINYSSQISAGTFPDSGDFSCNSALGSTPTLSQGGSNDLGGREKCLFLGRALQVETIGGGVLNVYTVIGNRQTSTGELATSISDTSPTPAMAPPAGGGSPVFVMKDTYTLTGGAKISAVSATLPNGATNNNWAMAGIYTDLNGTASSTVGNLQLDLIGYPLPSGGTSSVKTCIEGTSCIPSVLSKWNLCVQDGGNTGRTILLSVVGNTNGVTTQQIDGGC